MPKSTRLSARLWERQRERVIALYRDHPLEAVVSIMARDYDFHASKMAFNKKLGRWNATRRRPRGATGERSSSVLIVKHNPSPEVISISSTSNLSTPEPDEPIFPSSPKQQARVPTTHRPSPSSSRDPSSNPRSFSPDRESVESLGSHVELAQSADSLADDVPSLFLIKAFGSHEVLPDHKIVETLDSILKDCENISTSDSLLVLDRLLAAYLFWLGPNHRSSILAEMRYCELEFSIRGPADTLRTRFLCVLDRLIKMQIISSEKDKFYDLEIVVGLWEEGFIDDEELFPVSMKINCLYQPLRTGADTVAWTRLSILEAWLGYHEKAN